MKFGIRTPSLKKSIKARTTGRAKRVLKKAVIPGYGKKGAGWATNPKKAAYNKIYNKTSIGIGDIISKKSKTQNKNFQVSPTIEMLERELQILNDCAEIMQTTANPETFFFRYELYIEKLSILSNAENDGINFEGDSPTDKLAEITKEYEKVKLINEMIDRYWNKTLVKMQTLKTDKGKENQIAKFKEELSKYELKMPKASIHYYQSKQ